MIRVLGLSFALLAAGCASTGNKALGGDPSIKVLASADLPIPDRSDLIGEDRPYLIGAFD